MGIPLLQTMVRINESLHKHKEGATAGLLNVADVSIHYRRRERTCHNIGPARERAFISVCENKGIKNNIYTIGVSKSTLVIGRTQAIMLINNGFVEHNMERGGEGER